MQAAALVQLARSGCEGACLEHDAEGGAEGEGNAAHDEAREEVVHKGAHCQLQQHTGAHAGSMESEDTELCVCVFVRACSGFNMGECLANGLDAVTPTRQAQGTRQAQSSCSCTTERAIQGWLHCPAAIAPHTVLGLALQSCWSVSTWGTRPPRQCHSCTPAATMPESTAAAAAVHGVVAS